MADARVETLHEHTHENVSVTDDGRRLVGPGGTELVNGEQPGTGDVRWIDRRSRWGNPFHLKGDGGRYDRAESVTLYRGWFLGHVEREEWTPEQLRGSTLACHCLPRLCHGVVVLNYLASTYGGQKSIERFADGG
jgi:hypothetical protein